MAYVPKSSLNGAFPDGTQRPMTQNAPLIEPNSHDVSIETGKKNWVKTIANDLIATDDGTVGDTIMKNIVEPAVQKTVANTIDVLFSTIKDAIITLICGPKYTPKGYKGGNGYVEYGKYSTSRTRDDFPFDTRNSSSFGSRVFGSSNIGDDFYRHIKCKSRGQAESILSDIRYCLSNWSTYRVSNLLTLLNQPPHSHNDVHYGWSAEMINRNTVSISMGHDENGPCWYLCLPEPVYMEV